MKEKLIELLTESQILCNDCGPHGNSYCIEAIADLIIANGKSILDRSEDPKIVKRRFYFDSKMGWCMAMQLDWLGQSWFLCQQIPNEPSEYIRTTVLKSFAPMKETLARLLEGCVPPNIETDDPHEICTVAYGNIADCLIAGGVTIPQWIPVTERLPDAADSYIVTIKSKHSWEKEYTYHTDMATYIPFEKAYIDGCWNTYHDWDEGQEYLHITHWMHRPVPAKGE